MNRKFTDLKKINGNKAELSFTDKNGSPFTLFIYIEDDKLEFFMDDGSGGYVNQRNMKIKPNEPQRKGVNWCDVVKTNRIIPPPCDGTFEAFSSKIRQEITNEL